MESVPGGPGLRESTPESPKLRESMSPGRILGGPKRPESQKTRISRNFVKIRNFVNFAENLEFAGILRFSENTDAFSHDGENDSNSYSFLQVLDAISPKIHIFAKS